MARKFFYICAGMLMLALSYHFGASTATAQAPSNSVVGVSIAATQSLFGVIVTANGDVYLPGASGPATWYRTSNIFAGSPTPALHESWGQLKARYRGAPVSTTPSATDR